MRYGLPIVAANFLYLMIPFVNRALVTKYYGFAETGQFSLALDIGTRVMAAIGTALDVLLFQIAVRADELHGPEHAKEQVASNMATVFAIILPTTIRSYLTHRAKGLIVPGVIRLWAMPAVLGVACGAAIAAFAGSAIMVVLVLSGLKHLARLK